jgi:hypothetical protein
MASDDPKQPGLADLNGEMVQAWSGALDVWWRTMMGDPQKVAQMAEMLRGRGLSGFMEGGSPTAAPPASVGSEDLDDVLQALELVETRLDRLEGQVQVIAETMTELVGHLERLQARVADADQDDA